MTSEESLSRFYREHAAAYKALVERQDYQGKILARINEIAPLAGRVLVEFGAGTGNLTLPLAVQAGQIFAFDLEPAMLQRARTLLVDSGMRNWTLAVGEHSSMPVASDFADIAIEGWSFSHALDLSPRAWGRLLDRYQREMTRCLKPGGIAIMIEDLGIAVRRPQPTAQQEEFHHYLRERHGFTQTWARSDYQFASPKEADELVRFFFGDALADECLDGDTVIVPECTGIWWKRLDSR